MVLLRADQVVKSFPSADGRTVTPVLRGISLTVQPGEMVSIVGPSGSGKSTLLYALSGLEPISSGTVELFGENLTVLSRGRLARLRREKVGFIFQSFNLIPSLTARENVALPARLSRAEANRSDVEQALTDVGLAERFDYRPSSLSGGQQQRVAIARVLASRPGLVFADEPTGALDTAAGGQVLDLLRSVASGDRSVVMVTHDLDAAARADRVLVLRDGVIHRELVAPTTEQVFEAVSTAGAAQ